MQEKGLINYRKHGEWELINLTEKGKLWNTRTQEDVEHEHDEARKQIRTPPTSIRELGNKSKLLGNKSELTRIEIRNSSEINPTYKYINNQLTNYKYTNQCENARARDTAPPDADETDCVEMPNKREKKPKTFNALEALIELGVDEQVADDWLKLRRRKRADLTRTALDGLVREANKAGISPAKAVRICAERGWQSFRADWDWRDDKPQGRVVDGSDDSDPLAYARAQSERMRPQIAAMFARRKREEEGNA